MLVKVATARFSNLILTGIVLYCGLFAAVPVLLLSQGALAQSSSPGTGTGINAAALPPLLSWGESLKRPEAVLLCLHGLGLHKGTYSELGNYMCKRNVSVYAIDLRGFGDWYLEGKPDLNLDQSLADIKQTVLMLKNKYPGAPIFLLGESMGGAVALRFSAENPGMISGLISSVPSGDRWSGLGSDLKVGLHVLAGGFDSRFDVGSHVMKHAAKSDEALRARWSSDPSSRKEFSANELIAFQNFMNKNNETARKLKDTPVLIIQGQHDKLVKQSGSFNVWDNLATPDKTFVESKTAEHLIFEYGKFSPDDISYLEKWMKKAMSGLPDQTVSEKVPELPPGEKVPSKDEILASSPEFKKKEESKIALGDASAIAKVSASAGQAQISYWLELMRDGKRYRCNNKTVFKSGDEIRLHLRSTESGYAYIIMKQGSSGSHAVLFPESRTGRNNSVGKDEDVALPSATWLKCDDKPGTEKICLVFSRLALDPDSNKYLNMKPSVIVSADRSGAKDLCPTRMQLSWDDPNPLIIPTGKLDYALASGAGSAVKVSHKDKDGEGPVLAIDIDLEHKP